MRAERLLSMILLLENKGHMKAEALARQLGVSERTIYRDVEALSLAGVPVYTQTGSNGGVFLEESYRFSLNGLNSSEVQALFALPTGGPLADIGLNQAYDNILIKLLAALPQLQQGEALRLQQRLHIDGTRWFRDEEPLQFLAEIQDAVWGDREVVLHYMRKDGQRSARRIQPFGIVAKDSIWYVVGRQPDGSMRSFRISRVESLTVTEVNFKRPADFDLVRFWRESTEQFERQFDTPIEPVNVRLRLHRDNFWLLTSMFSGLIDVLTDPDAAWVEAEVRSYYPLPMVLRMGTYAEILSPAWLRKEIREAALEIAERYS